MAFCIFYVDEVDILCYINLELSNIDIKVLRDIRFELKYFL